MTDLQLMATCPKGLGSLLVEELASLGAVELRETVAGVTFSGPQALAYRACLHSRLANRVLLTLDTFEAESADALYAGAGRIAWGDHLRPEGTLAVDFSGQSRDIRNTRFGAQRVKDAIVDQFRARGLPRPSVNVDRPDLRVNVRLHRGRVTVAIDLSGESLHRRGYRTDPGKAPLKENLAAAVLLRSGWPAAVEQGWPLIDPMCGAGTLLVEAAFMAIRRPPGLGRRHHGFDGWLGHNEPQWRAVLAEGREQVIEPPAGVEIRGYDGDIRAVKRAEAAIAELELGHWVRVRPKALNELVRPSHRPMPSGLLVCNPPWGGRLGDQDTLPLLYRRLGEKLHSEFRGWHAGIVTSDKSLGRSTGLRSHRQYRFNNGAVDIHLLLFALDEDNHLADKPTAAAAESYAGVDAQNQDEAQTETVPALTPGAQMFANRLKKNLRRLSPWLKREGISCYRLYDADMPEYAVAVDVYGGRPHVAEYAPPKSVDDADAQRRFGEVIAGVQSALGMRGDQEIAAKRRQRQRGKDQYRRQDQRGERIEVEEGDARLLVNLYDYLDTGLFLDHRPLRLRLGREARGKHFLNLFCYTGAASVHAALGGAATSTSVDLSNTYLNWFRANLALNGLSERQHRAERADCLAWLKACEREFDLILLDPPSFSNSKSIEASFDVQRDHRELIELAMARLARDGTLYFSNNRRGFKLDAAVSEAYSVQDITATTIPEDFSRNGAIHQCWQIRHGGRDRS